MHSADAQSRFTYADNRDQLKRALGDGLDLCLAIADACELDKEVVLGACRQLCQRLDVAAISPGNGHASRGARAFIRAHLRAGAGQASL